MTRNGERVSAVSLSFWPMRPFLPLLATASIVAGASFGAGAVSASADDQADADAAIDAFNERMTEAGAFSSGPPDMEPLDPEAEEGLPTECVGQLDIALDDGGHVEGETARAFSDDFKFSDDAPASSDPADVVMLEGDDVNAAVITVDEANIGTIDDLVEMVGSEEMATCLEDTFAELMDQASAEASDVTIPQFTIEVDTESDLGIGDASARFSLTIESQGYSSVSTGWIARSDRSLAFVGLSTTGEQVSDFDGEAELGDLVDSL